MVTIKSKDDIKKIPNSNDTTLIGYITITLITLTILLVISNNNIKILIKSKNILPEIIKQAYSLSGYIWIIGLIILGVIGKTIMMKIKNHNYIINWILMIYLIIMCILYLSIGHFLINHSTN